MFLRRLRILVFRSALTSLAVSVLLWAWGCSNETSDPYDSPAFGILSMAPAPASELTTIEFNGTVTAVTDPDIYLTGEIGVGDALFGQFVYDETAPDEHPKPDVGRYRFRQSQYMVAVNAGRLFFASDPTTVDITIKLLDDKKTSVLKDQYEVKSTSNRDALPGVGVVSINLLLEDETATALSGDALANQRPDAATWLPTRRLTITGVDGWTVEANIDLIASSEPADQRRTAKEEIHESD